MQRVIHDNHLNPVNEIFTGLKSTAERRMQQLSVDAKRADCSQSRPLLQTTLVALVIS